MSKKKQKFKLYKINQKKYNKNMKIVCNNKKKLLMNK